MIEIGRKKRVNGIIESFTKAIKELQQRSRIPKPDEDKYTLYLKDLLNQQLQPHNYFVHCQEPSGKTPSGYDITQIHGGLGEVDLKIIDKKNNEIKHIGEALILDSLDKSYISEHFRKIFDNDPNGLALNFIVVYSKAKDFILLWKKYLEYVNQFEWKFPIEHNVTDHSETILDSAEIKVALSEHLRQQKVITICHFFCNFT
jgi:hypothetical protein